MKSSRRTAGFTLIELLVALTITAGLAATLLVVTSGTLKLWGRTQDSFTTEFQAALVLDYLERDLHCAVFRDDGQTWLAVDLTDNAATLSTHGWLTSSRMKPAGGESQRYVGALSAGPVISEARFGLSGAWLRFITFNADTDGTLPVAVSYQLARRPLTGAISSTNSATVRYTLFRSAVAADVTFSTGTNILAVGYASTSTNPGAQRSASTLTNPNTTSDVIATNVVDFGVWLWGMNSAGDWVRLFPASSSDGSHVANRAGTFPVAVDVMVRILTEEGARLVAAMEQGDSVRPPNFSSDGEWWWAVVEAHSSVTVRRLAIKTRSS